ncbi:PDZ domain-containing protein [Nakamurella panacisegetis]|uniref:PDZ domain-containing protein n=1 Tax=Nakamurella panacisegetis TaxID=1090615 RepID=A0A1H0HQC5_9ACTN|nr:PDZ domain-containing protein [Nakamurella panacisegetis]SDO21011.1 PDZ domain-containing protein [Nakamurella panacisegetis]
MSWFSSLSIRARALIVGSTLSVALVGVGATVPVPYVALGPGVTYDTLSRVGGTPVISFSGDAPASVKQTDGTGHLNMTTVSVYDDMPLFGLLGMWMSGDYAVVPRAEVYPPDKTVDQVNQQNTKDFQDSQSAAEIAALRYLKYPNVVYVGTIAQDSPSYKVLEPQDQITAVDGAKVTDFASLQAALKNTLPGQTVEVTVLRGSRSVDAKVKLQANSSAGKQGFLGIGAVERPKAPFTISISLANIGGPSAGLMFTLGILDKLTPGGLTAGRFIAGTGTMEVDDTKGTVGEIGGILLKMIAAKNAGASVFLVPAGNCAEALTRVPQGLELVRVATLDDAVKALKTLGAGGTPPSC